MKSAVIVFPGSNCERDLYNALKKTTDTDCSLIWYKETSLPSNLDILFIPGGFSFGDYLRCGAIAAKSPIIKAVLKFASRGGYIVGICNGFQVLTEIGLLKGALIRNSNLRFICKQQAITVENSISFFRKKFKIGEEIILPIAHHDGNFYAESNVLKELEGNGQIVLRYKINPNGSRNSIAGIASLNGRVVGMMPHPERAVDQRFSSNDGSVFFNSIEKYFVEI